MGRIEHTGACSSTTANQPTLWHVAAYDRFTGGSWIRSGGTIAYSGPLPPPPGETAALDQTFEAATTIYTMPAAWKPVRVGSELSQRTRVTDLGGLQPTRSLSEGDTYFVTSARPKWTRPQLRNADAPLPDSIRERYLQLPNSTPQRIRRFAAELTTDVDTWFDKAAVIEQWLEENKEYSLEVTRPDGNIADAFIFEMERGYCVYFATAMTAMLRTLGIPARFTVGYTPGQPVDEDEWVVRGFNSHAWVEVFFPEIGWVSFDPTPSGPRQAARQRELEEARAANTTGVDTAQTRPPTTSGITQNREAGQPTSRPDSVTEANRTGGVVSERDGQISGRRRPLSLDEQDGAGVSRRGLLTTLTEIDQLAIGAGVVGVALGINRVHLLRRAYRFVLLGWQAPTDDPREDIERAFDRLERVLARQYRGRRTGETRRDYVDSVRAARPADGRVQRVLDIYETSLYKGEPSRARADEAIEHTDAVVREQFFPRW